MVGVDGEFEVHDFALELERLESVCGDHGEAGERALWSGAEKEQAEGERDLVLKCSPALLSNE